VRATCSCCEDDDDDDDDSAGGDDLRCDAGCCGGSDAMVAGRDAVDVRSVEGGVNLEGDRRRCALPKKAVKQLFPRCCPKRVGEDVTSAARHSPPRLCTGALENVNLGPGSTPPVYCTVQRRCIRNILRCIYSCLSLHCTQIHS
jgi:hypothetical protein